MGYPTPPVVSAIFGAGSNLSNQLPSSKSKKKKKAEDLMRIEHYATQDEDGNQVEYYGEGLQAYQDAKASAEENRLQVIALQFEYTDSELVDDFTCGKVE